MWRSSLTVLEQMTRMYTRFVEGVDDGTGEKSVSSVNEAKEC